MTKEEAIRVIEIIEKRFITLDKEELQALDMAIKALENEPKFLMHSDGRIEHIIEPCDCISRQAVISKMRNLYPDIPFVNFNNARLKWLRKYKPYLDCEEVVKSMPSVQKKGGD